MLSIRRQLFTSSTKSFVGITTPFFSKRFSSSSKPIIDYSSESSSSTTTTKTTIVGGSEQSIHKEHHVESVLFSPSVPQTGRRIETAPTNGAEWRELAHSMTHQHQTVVVDGVHYNQVECILRALQHDPKDSVTWYELGTAILGGAKVGSYTAVGSFQQCVTIDKQNGAAWTALGSVMGTFDVITIGDMPFSKQTCFEKALELNKEDALAWMCLADFLAARPPKKTSGIEGDLELEEKGTVGGKQVTALEAYTTVLNLEPHRFPAWNNCALVLLGKPVYVNGRPKAPSIQCRKTVTVRGIPYNCLGCFVKAIELDPSYAFVWKNLAVCIPKEVESEFKVTIHDKQYLRQEMLNEAERLDAIAEHHELHAAPNASYHSHHHPAGNAQGQMGLPEMGEF